MDTDMCVMMDPLSSVTDGRGCENERDSDG